MRAADVVIVVSGTDGALPSVVAGLVSAPIIAVVRLMRARVCCMPLQAEAPDAVLRLQPTSVGYGASLGGVSALLGSLTASSPGTPQCKLRHEHVTAHGCTTTRSAELACTLMLQQHTWRC